MAAVFPIPLSLANLQAMFGSNEFLDMFEKMREYTERTGALPKVGMQFEVNKDTGECECPQCQERNEKEFASRVRKAMETRKLAPFMHIRRDGLCGGLSRAFLEAELHSAYSCVPRDNPEGVWNSPGHQEKVTRALMNLFDTPLDDDSLGSELILSELGFRGWNPCTDSYECAFRGKLENIEKFKPVFTALTRWWLTDTSNILPADYVLLAFQLTFLAEQHGLFPVSRMFILRELAVTRESMYPGSSLKHFGEDEGFGAFWRHFGMKPSDHLQTVLGCVSALKDDLALKYNLHHKSASSSAAGDSLPPNLLALSRVESVVVDIAKVCGEFCDPPVLRRHLRILWTSMRPIGKLANLAEAFTKLCFDASDSAMARSVLLDRIMAVFTGTFVLDDLRASQPSFSAEQQFGLLATGNELDRYRLTIANLLAESSNLTAKKEAPILAFKKKLVQAVEKTGVMILDVPKALAAAALDSPSLPPVALEALRLGFAELAGNKTLKAEAEAALKALVKAEAEAEAATKAAAQAKAKAEAEALAKARAEAEAQARAEAVAKAKAEAEAKAEAAAHAKAEAAAKAEAKAAAKASKAAAYAAAQAAVKAAAEAEARAEAEAEALLNDEAEDEVASPVPVPAVPARTPAFVPGLVAEFIEASDCRKGGVPREAAIQELSDRILAGMLEANTVLKNAQLLEKLISCILKAKTKLKPAVCEAVATLAMNFTVSDPEELRRRTEQAQQILYYNSTSRTVLHTAAAPPQKSPTPSMVSVSTPTAAVQDKAPVTVTKKAVAKKEVKATEPQASGFKGDIREFRSWRWDTLKKIPIDMLNESRGFDVIVTALAEPIRSAVVRVVGALQEPNVKILAAMTFLSEELKGGHASNPDLAKWEKSSLYQQLLMLADGIKATRDREIALASLWWEAKSFDEFMLRFAALGGSL